MSKKKDNDRKSREQMERKVKNSQQEGQRGIIVKLLTVEDIRSGKYRSTYKCL